MCAQYASITCATPSSPRQITRSRASQRAVWTSPTPTSAEYAAKYQANGNAV